MGDMLKERASAPMEAMFCGNSKLLKIDVRSAHTE